MDEITENGWKNLAQLLGRKFPNRKNLKITDLGEITEGWETKIYSLSLNYEVEGELFTEDFILRVFQGTHKRNQARKEFNLMKKVSQFGIPVPRVDLLVTDDSLFGNPFIVMEKIQGGTVSHALRGASEQEILTLMNVMVFHFVKLHQIPWQKIFDDEKPGEPIPAEPLAFIRTNLFDMQETVNRYELHDFDPLLNWLEERMEPGIAPRLCVMHNDYHPLNLLVRESGDDLAIIDWSFAEVGDYRLDLAWSVLLFGVMVGAPYREILVKTYEDIAGCKVENFEYFEVLKFAARMLTIATWLDESVVIPVKKITREAIRGEYKVHVLNVYDRLKEITGLELPLIENL